MLMDLNLLIDNSVKRKIRAGSVILYQGEVPRSASVLIRGVVSVYGISPQGDEQTIMFHVDGEFFPSSWIFGKSSSTLFFYQAMTECEVAFVPRDTLVEYMTSDMQRMANLLDYFTSNYTAALIRVNALEQQMARDKIIHTLYFLFQRYGVPGKRARTIIIPIALTHQKIGSLVGLTRETVAVEMNKLKKQGAVYYKKQHYIIHLDVFFVLMGEDSFREILIQD